jgi:hypothetical protein
LSAEANGGGCGHEKSEWEVSQEIMRFGAWAKIEICAVNAERYVPVFGTPRQENFEMLVNDTVMPLHTETL